MEMILALVVVIAVIIFGALISIGNERQRKAIDGLREQVVLWAMQDLRLKRESLIGNIQIENPLTWLNKLSAKVVGYDLRLQSMEYFETPKALVCTMGDKAGKAIFSPLSMVDIARLKKSPKSRLDQFSQINPLYSIPRNATSYKISILNTWILFDLELQAAWKKISGQDFGQVHHLWLYLLE